MPDRTELTGWGRTAPTSGSVLTIAPSDVPAMVRSAGTRGVIARGLGRSYGDAAQNAGGSVLVPNADNIEVTSTGGSQVVRVGAGVSLHTLMNALLPHGLFVPVTPGTRQVTVGGALAADIHGKNHHVDGSLARHVVEIVLVDADGELRRIGPTREHELFWATAGGMGLTGVITEVTLRPLSVETSFVRVETQRAPDLATVMRLMREGDADHRYSVAWIDTLARGRSMGRSVLTRGDHARAAAIDRDPGLRAGTLVRSRARVPIVPPVSVLARPSVRVFNELWFRRAPRGPRVTIESLGAFFHPLDAVADWNRLYGPRGLVQYQFVVPDDADDALRRAVELISDAGHPAFLAVLKRFGESAPGPLSFPMPGWTLALDLATRPALATLFDALDDVVVAAGGRVYLAKDARLAPATLDRMYPRLDEFRAVRRRVDPRGVFQSDLSRRLRL